jgi:site-specific recombinase XerD
MDIKTKEAVERFLKHGNKRGGNFSQQTINRYRMDLDEFFEFVKKDFTKITRRDCEDFKEYLESRKKNENLYYCTKCKKNHLKSNRTGMKHLKFKSKEKTPEKLKMKSVYHKIAAVKSFYRFIIEDEEYGVSKSPMYFKIPDKDMQSTQSWIEQQILSRKELRDLFNATKNSRDNTILTLLYNTGMRVSELTGLDLDSISMEREKITIIGKGNKVRIISFDSDDIKQALKIWLLVRPKTESNAIFTTKFGSRVDQVYVRDLVKRKCKEVGIIRKITPHSFRHTFATHAVEDGVSLAEIAARMGWNSIEMIMKYIAFAKIGNTMKKNFKGIHKESKNMRRAS